MRMMVSLALMPRYIAAVISCVGCSINIVIKYSVLAHLDSLTTALLQILICKYYTTVQRKSRKNKVPNSLFRQFDTFLVLQRGFEPRTPCLKGRCSAC